LLKDKRSSMCFLQYRWPRWCTAYMC